MTVSVEWKVSTTASIATLGARAYVNGAPDGSELVNTAEPTADTIQTFPVSGLTRAQLLDAAFKIRVRATRGNTNTAFTASLDAVSVQVDYTVPGNQTLTTDANGNLVARAADAFSYDQANRLTSATVAGATETYTYDGDGTRFSRQVGAGPLTRYVSDVNAGLPVTLDDGNRKYVWGQGLVYAVSGSSVEVYHTDRLGSVRAITDATGTVTATYRTDGFGIPTATTGSSTQPFGYTGEPRDATGLVFLRARYYDPGLGRFMSRDGWSGTAQQPTNLNRFSYASGNPTSFIDPTGFSANPSRVLRSAGVCYSGSVGAGILNMFGGYAVAGLCPVVDVSGRRSILVSLGGGEILGLTAGASGGPVVSNGLIGDLGGWFSAQGGFAGNGPSVGLELAHTGDFSTVVISPQVGAALRLPVPGEVHSGTTYTWIIDGPVSDVLAFTNPLIGEGWIVGGALLTTFGAAGL